jgi:preprotein translocase subunit SecF
MKSKVNFFREKRGSALVQVIVIVGVIILVAVTVGMFRFNFLASLDDFDVDGNKVNVQEEVASVEKKKEVPKTMEKAAIEPGNEIKSKLEDEVEVIKETEAGDKQEEAKEIIIKKYGDFKFNENTKVI